MEDATMKLYYCETMNPRKACATAKHLGLPVEYQRIDLGRGEHKLPDHLARNPNGRLPVLVDGDQSLWESAAIMVHLAVKAGSEMWPRDGSKQAEVMRWVSWNTCEFAPHASAFYFENDIKPRLLNAPPNVEALRAAAPRFHQAARILDGHLQGRDFVVGDALTIADFCLGVLLPDAHSIELPVDEYRNIARWHDGLMALPAWRNPWPELAITSLQSSGRPRSEQ
jgi:glutathione S-transferase